jgi:hypothetical protein
MFALLWVALSLQSMAQQSTVLVLLALVPLERLPHVAHPL